MYQILIQVEEKNNISAISIGLVCLKERGDGMETMAGFAVCNCFLSEKLLFIVVLDATTFC